MSAELNDSQRERNMYFLLTWSIDSGPTPDEEIEAMITDRMDEFKPQCDIIADHTRIFRGKDGAFENLLFDLHQIRLACNNQLNWALLRCGERTFDGDGFDRDAALKVIT